MDDHRQPYNHGDRFVRGSQIMPHFDKNLQVVDHGQADVVGQPQNANLDPDHLDADEPEDLATKVPQMDETVSSACGTLKYKLMYIPSILAKRHLVRKLARFGRLRYFEFIPGEFSNKIPPEELEQSKAKFQDFKGAEFIFELEHSEKLFLGVKRLRVKGLQIKVIPSVSQKESMPVDHQVEPLVVPSEDYTKTTWQLHPVQNNKVPYSFNHPTLLSSAKDESQNSAFQEDREVPDDRELLLSLKPTSKKYHVLHPQQLTDPKTRFVGERLLRGKSTLKELTTHDFSQAGNYRLNLLSVTDQNRFLSKYNSVKKLHAIIMLKKTSASVQFRK